MGKTGYKVICSKCGSSGPYVRIADFSNNKMNAQEEARRAWNSRITSIGGRIMRLIDADRLKEELSLQWLIDILLTNRNSADVLSALAEKIDSQSTAYDVDKVVERLETEGSKIEIQYENNYEKGILDGIGKAIEIVKAGGVDESR